MFKRWRRRRILARHSIPDDAWAGRARGLARARALDGRAARPAAHRSRCCFCTRSSSKPRAAWRSTRRSACGSRRWRACRFSSSASMPTAASGPSSFIPTSSSCAIASYEDEDGVVHIGDDVLSGEAWEQGPVVLAWSEIEESGRGEGYNVVVHEFVHKLDMLGGEADGVPPLHGDMRVPEWVAAFDAAYDDLMRAARARRGAVARSVRRRGSRRVLRRLRGDVLRRAAAAFAPSTRTSTSSSSATSSKTPPEALRDRAKSRSCSSRARPSASRIMPMSHSGRRSYQKPKSRLCRPL